MNISTTLASPLIPRQMTTGTLIVAGHVLLLGLIILNPVRHFQQAPKETVVLMMPSAMPKLSIPEPKLAKLPAAPSSAVPMPEQTQMVLKSESKDAIMLAPAASEVPVTATPAPVAAPVIAKAEPAAPKIVSAVEYLQAPQADYPALARRMGEEGRVVLQVLVNDKGRAEKVEVVKSSGFARLDESAKTALLRALFKPYVEDGKATMMIATASINFSLRG